MNKLKMDCDLSETGDHEVLSLNADIADFGDDNGPEILITMKAAKSFEACAEYGNLYYLPDDDYYGEFGIYSIPLKRLLEHYLVNTVEFDGGDHSKELASMLRDYADKLDQLYQETQDYRDERMAGGDDD